MEEERANGADVGVDAISNIKTALMGPLAGVGDAITQGIVKVILLAIGIDLAMEGNPLGSLLFVLIFSVYALGGGYTCYMTGYKMGKNAVVKILSGGLIKEITEGCGAMGMMVLGGLVATKIGITTQLSFTLGEKVTEVQGLLDQIMPALLPLALFFGVYGLLRKGITPMKTMGMIFLAGIVLSLTGILG